jgi:DNA-binding NtrC family response regulator
MANTDSSLKLLHDRAPEETPGIIRDALFKAAGDVKVAAAILDVQVKCLWRWMWRLGMEKEPPIIREEMAGRFRLTG